MTPGAIDLKIVGDRLRAVRLQVSRLRELPAASVEEFTADFRTPAAAESLLRRSIEALLDVARHLLAKGHGIGSLEYREVARLAGEKDLVSDAALRERFVQISGFRNRLTHYYEEVTPQELHAILRRNLEDLERLADALAAAARRMASG